VKVQPSSLDELAPAAKTVRGVQVAAATKGPGGFASAMTRSLKAEAATEAKATPDATATPDAKVTPGSKATETRSAVPNAKRVAGLEGSGVPEPIKLRKGEAMTQVEGRAYAEVTEGKRDGMFINTTNNVRRGQAFVLVFKNDTEYHIYGTGKDRVVVSMRRRDDATPAATPTGTTPVVSTT
jgi:hypothetical protein